MKKPFSPRSLALSIIAISLLTIIVIITTTSSKADSPLATRLSGRILLQAEDSGQAWYVSPDNNQRMFLGSPQEAFNLMRTLGLGISNNDLNKYLNKDINKFPTRLSGKILLAVEKNGEAYYINPLNLQGYYLGRPLDAFNLMRELALGITNTNLDTIEVFKQEEIDSQQPTTPIEETETNISLVTNPVAPMTNFSHIVSVSATLNNPDNISIKEKGLLYDFTISPNTNLNPTLDKYNQKIISISDTNDYTLDITNLNPSSYPFIRAYVITENNQVFYGNTITIVSEQEGSLPSLPVSSISSVATPSVPLTPAWACGDLITDSRDNNVYNTVEIGDQCWFQKNLAYLPEVHSNTEFSTQGSSKLSGYGVYGYNGSDVATAKSQSNYSDYGVLYNWYAVDQVDLCPIGWHVPSDTEFTTLTDWLISDGVVTVGQEGTALKSVTWDGNNSSGFTVLPAGGRGVLGVFDALGLGAHFWSSSETGPVNSWNRNLGSGFTEVGRDSGYQAYGCSVRCLKDTPKTITYVAGEGGFINATGTGTTTQTVNYGDDGEEVIAVPDTGYEFVSWSDGSTSTTRTDLNITSDITVEAEFKIPYTLTYTAGSNGSLTGSTTQIVLNGNDGGAVTAIPEDGYYFFRWSDGSFQNPRTDKNISDNLNVEAEFGYGLIKNGGFEVVEERLSNWNLMGRSMENLMSEIIIPGSCPVKSIDSSEGEYAVEFKGSDELISMIMYEKIILASTTNYLLKLDTKSPENLNGIFGVALMDENARFWNFSSSEGSWVSTMNPFGDGYFYNLALSSDYSEIVVPEIKGDDLGVNIIIFATGEDYLVDNVSFQEINIEEGSEGDNLFKNASFESWVTLPVYWKEWGGNKIESVNDVSRTGDYSVFLANNTIYKSAEFSYKFYFEEPITGPLSLSFWGKTNNIPVTNMYIFVEGNDKFYDFNQYSAGYQTWTIDFNEILIPLTDEFTLITLPEIKDLEDKDYFRVAFKTPWETLGESLYIDDVVLEFSED